MKNKSFNWVSFWLIILGCFLIVRSAIMISGATDVNFHNTYFVVANMHIGIGIGSVLLIVAGIYWLFIKVKRPLNKVLAYTHLVLVIISLSILSPIRFPGLDGGPRRYYSYGTTKEPFIDWQNPEVMNKAITISSYIFLTGLLLLTINIIISLIRKKQHTI